MFKRALAGLTIATLATLCPQAAPAADLYKGALFTSEETLQVVISAPWREVLRAKDNKGWPATLVVQDPGGKPLTVNLTVERRGISRQRVCDFPPIRLRFDKESVNGTLFQGEGALKLVTHCGEGQRWASYYVLEMAAYRMFNLVTDYSLRVRPMQIRYRDTQRESEPETHFAFVIEDIDELADRHDLVEIEVPSTLPSRLDPLAASRAALFQYMVGNLDWSAIRGPDGECCHNVKLIGAENDPQGDGTPLVPVPYDFDSTGLVDAHYADPPQGLGVRRITTRMYRGYCRHNPQLPATRAEFRALEPEIRAVIANESRLEPRERQKALDYLDEFFAVLAEDQQFEKEITESCRG